VSPLGLSSRIRQALLGYWGADGFEKDFWLFLLASGLFSFGLISFFFLYNLYLLDRGFDDEFIGVVATATTIGSIAGTLPAVHVMQRLGLKRTLLLCLIGAAMLYALRVVVLGERVLLGVAFLSGVLTAVWSVLIAVIISHVTSARARSHAFSLFFATTIGIGALADGVSGRLAQWLAPLLGGDGAKAKQAVLLLGCGITALSAWPAFRLHLTGSERSEHGAYPRGPFIASFVAALAVWNIAIGAFNPFAGCYFSQYLKMPVRRVGRALAGSEIAQALGVLLVPPILRRFGTVRGIMGMQLAAAMALAFLATGPPALAAGLGFMGFMAFFSMTDPGITALLMSRVRVEERGGASSLLYLVTFSAQAVASTASGAGLQRFGYPAVLAAAAAVAALAGVLFRMLLGPFGGRVADADENRVEPSGP